MESNKRRDSEGCHKQSDMSAQFRTIKEIQVEDVQKRRIPSKHYVYLIKVIWSDGTRHVIYRRYSRFFDFQLSLLDRFPLEAGAIDPSKRIIPFLPGKIIFGRSHVREVAVKRLRQIDDYCSALIKLPPLISEDEEVIDFFDLEPDDINPPEHEQKQNKNTADNISGPTLAEQYVVISDYKKTDKWDLNLKAGMILEVVEKSDSGWWFVSVDDKQGWVPSSYLERKDGLRENTAIRTNLGEDERYICTANYVPQNTDEIPLEKGSVVEVLEKNLDGWWFGRCNNKEGIVPSTYLMKTEKAHIERVARASGVEIVGRLSDVSDLLKESRNSESLGDSRGNVQHILKKQKSLERGGSLRPPPRLNSVTKKGGTSKAPDEVINSLKKIEEHYVTVSEFVDTVGDGITFGKGEIVEVSEKSDSGWWFVKINGVEGWAPASYIGKTHMVDIEEEDNVYQDIGEIDSDLGEKDKDDDDDDDYEVPDPVKDDKLAPQNRENKVKNILPIVPMRKKQSDHDDARHLKGLSDKGAVKRPNSKPPPPPIGFKSTNVDINDNLSSPKSLNGPPVPPPKKVIKDKPILAQKDDSSGSHNFNEVLKSKFSSNGPLPPPKNQRLSEGKVHDKRELPGQSKVSLNELQNQITKKLEVVKGGNLAPEGQKQYKYTDVVPKAGHKGDNLSPATSPKSDAGVKGFVLPPMDLQKQEALRDNIELFSQKQLKQVHQKDISNQKVDDCDGIKSMGELKARFQKQRPDLSAKPVIKSKTAIDSKTSDSNKLHPESLKADDDKPASGMASALKAMFEHSTTESGATKLNVAKTSSSSSNSSKTSAILKPVTRTNNSSNPPVLPSKTNIDFSSKLPPNVPHKPLKSKTSNPPPLPAKSYGNKQEKNVTPKLSVPPKPMKVDTNHNEMESKQKGNLIGLSKVLTSKIQSNINPIKSVPPSPPVKDYHMPSNFSTPCYKTVADLVSEGEGQVGFVKGEIVDVIEENEFWWFIRVHGEEGWAPADLIEQCEIELSDQVFHKQYRATTEFITDADGEVGLGIGDVLDVIEETDTGWWFVKNGETEGWAPSSYLEPI